MKYKNVLDLIGNTPIVKIQKLNPNPSVNIFAKLEGNNPGGSIKDRVAKYMIEKAEKDGLLRKGKILIEATSGNTGIGLAMLAAFKGYKFVAIMPESASIERIKALKAYGANVILTSADKGTNGSINVAKSMLKQNKNYVMLDQFNNPTNVLAHYETTGVEILNDVPQVDFFIAGMGTGGTLMGVGKRLKEYSSKIKIIGVEPLITSSKIQGLRNMKAYIPAVFEENKLDRKITVKDEDAFRISKLLFSKEGISVGISSGAAMWAAMKIARSIKRGNIIILFPDRGDKYYSTKLFN
jgi:S-sulfo-L-cysteine synthase (O-acetyl-L-serine-dependent)